MRESINSPSVAGIRGAAGPAARLVRAIAGRWTLAVLAEPAHGGRRYQDLHDRVESIAHKVLTETRRRAERDDLVTRHLDVDHIERAAVDQLTDLGRSLPEPLAEFDRWVVAN